MIFTLATKNDIEELIKIRLAFIYSDLSEFDIQRRKQIEDQLPNYFDKHLDNDLIVFIAKDNNKIISAAFLVINEKPASINFPTGRIGQVLSVYTYKEYRKQGIVKKLMQMLISHSKELELDFIELNVGSIKRP